MRMLFKTHLNYLNLLFFNLLLSPLNGRKSGQYLNLDNNMLFDEAEDNKKFTDLISDSLSSNTRKQLDDKLNSFKRQETIDRDILSSNFCVCNKYIENSNTKNNYILKDDVNERDGFNK